MTEDEARAWVRERFGVSRETALAELGALVLAEAGNQNLIAASTQAQLWLRHLTDSAQLVPHAPSAGLWVDIGSGAGFPGLVAALLRDGPTLLIEPRRKRAAFLEAAIAALGLGARAQVACCKAERASARAAVISARAVAALPELLALSHHLSTSKTRWLLPKGKSAAAEVALARRAWHGVFHVEQSLTDPDSLLIIAEDVQPK